MIQLQNVLIPAPNVSRPMPVLWLTVSAQSAGRCFPCQTARSESLLPRGQLEGQTRLPDTTWGFFLPLPRRRLLLPLPLLPRRQRSDLRRGMKCVSLLIYFAPDKVPYILNATHIKSIIGNNINVGGGQQGPSIYTIPWYTIGSGNTR